MLTQEQIGSYHQNGYRRIRGVYSSDEVEAMRADLDHLLQDGPPLALAGAVLGGTST